MKWWSVICLAFILGNGRAAHADTEIDGTATGSSSFTFTSTVGISTLTVSNMLTASSITINSGFQSLNGVVYAWPSAQGSANTLLRNDGSGNLSWALKGQVVQVINTTNTGQGTTTTTSFANMGPGATITPKSSSDNVLLIWCGQLGVNGSGVTVQATIAKNSSNLVGAGGLASIYSSAGSLETPTSYVHSATTSSTSYNLYLKTSNSSTAGTMGDTNQTNTFMAIEIGS